MVVPVIPSSTKKIVSVYSRCIRAIEAIPEQERGYLGWDYSAPETAVMGVAIHAFEWGFVRLAPFALIAATVGVFLTRKKHKV